MKRLALLVPPSLTAEASHIHTQALRLCRESRARVTEHVFTALIDQYLRRAGALRLQITTQHQVESLRDAVYRMNIHLEHETGDGYWLCSAVSDYGDRLVGRRLACDPAPALALGRALAQAIAEGGEG